MYSKPTVAQIYRSFRQNKNGDRGSCSRRGVQYPIVLQRARLPDLSLAIAPMTLRRRLDSLLPLSPAPASHRSVSSTTAATLDDGGADGDGDKADAGDGGGGGGGGASSLLEDLMGGLNLSGFGVSDSNEASTFAVS